MTEHTRVGMAVLVLQPRLRVSKGVTTQRDYYGLDERAANAPDNMGKRHIETSKFI